MLKQIWISIVRLCSFLLIVIKTFPRDIRAVCKLLKHIVLTKYYMFRKQDFIDIFRENVKRYPTKSCFIFDDKILSFQQV